MVYYLSRQGTLSPPACDLPLYPGSDHYIAGRQLELAVPSGARSDKPLVHWYLAASPQDRRLSDKEWADIGRRFAERLYPNAPWLSYLHTDKDHHHLHVIACRYARDGRLVNEYRCKERAAALMREVETAFNLRPNPFRPRVGRPNRSQLANPLHRELQEVLKSAAAATTLDGFLAQLADRGIGASFFFDDDGPRGLSFSVRGQYAVNGRAVGVSYFSLARRFNLGSRDYPALLAANAAAGRPPHYFERRYSPADLAALPSGESPLFGASVRYTAGGARLVGSVAPRPARLPDLATAVCHANHYLLREGSVNYLTLRPRDYSPRELGIHGDLVDADAGVHVIATSLQGRELQALAALLSDLGVDVDVNRVPRQAVPAVAALGDLERLENSARARAREHAMPKSRRERQRHFYWSLYRDLERLRDGEHDPALVQRLRRRAVARRIPPSFEPPLLRLFQVPSSGTPHPDLYSKGLEILREGLHRYGSAVFPNPSTYFRHLLSSPLSPSERLQAHRDLLEYLSRDGAEPAFWLSLLTPDKPQVYRAAVRRERSLLAHAIDSSPPQQREAILRSAEQRSRRNPGSFARRKPLSPGALRDLRRRALAGLDPAEVYLKAYASSYAASFRPRAAAAYRKLHQRIRQTTDPDVRAALELRLRALVARRLPRLPEVRPTPDLIRIPALSRAQALLRNPHVVARMPARLLVAAALASAPDLAIVTSAVTLKLRQLHSQITAAQDVRLSPEARAALSLVRLRLRDAARALRSHEGPSRA